MPNTQEFYRQQVAAWPSAERLQLAALILADITAKASPPPPQTRSIVELIESFAPGRGFASASEADEFLRQERDSWER